MRTTRGMLRVAVATAFLAVGAGTALAETYEGPGKNTLEIRLINNNASVVRVMVQDAKGRIHQLGRVAPTDFGILEVARAITDLGSFRIAIYPAEPVGSLQGEADGVRTRGLDLTIGDAVNFWVEPNMTDSKVELIEG